VLELVSDTWTSDDAQSTECLCTVTMPVATLADDAKSCEDWLVSLVTDD
jgi:hypothetical protein